MTALRLAWRRSAGGRPQRAADGGRSPDRRRARDGKYVSGDVTFEPAGADRTEVTVEMTYDHEGLLEAVGSALGFDDRRVKGDLKRFKELVESRGRETGAWRGEVHRGEVTSR